jgi:hypothetical protein
VCEWVEWGIACSSSSVLAPASPSATFRLSARLNKHATWMALPSSPFSRVKYARPRCWRDVVAWLPRTDGRMVPTAPLFYSPRSDFFLGLGLVRALGGVWWRVGAARPCRTGSNHNRTGASYSSSSAPGPFRSSASLAVLSGLSPSDKFCFQISFSAALSITAAMMCIHPREKERED